MSAPKMCQACGRQPESYHGRRWCYDCKPGTNGRPLPCRRCGATGDYWAHGLCRRCHRFAPHPPESCPDCLAWGTTRTLKWLCAACVSWRYLHPGTSKCLSCGRDIAVNEHQACRLCWLQTFSYQAQVGLPRDVRAANKGGQQLWFANMSDPRNGYRPHPRRDYRQPRDQVRPPGQDTRAKEPARSRRDHDPNQLDLFAYHRIENPARRFGFGEPPNGRLAALLDDQVLAHAQRYGWTERQTTRTRITLRVLQAKHHVHAPPIKASDVLALRNHDLPIRLAMAFLAANDLLLEDRVPTLDAWFARQLVDLPDPMAAELRLWFQILHNGSTTPPRSYPRHDGTIKTRTTWAMPTLRVWAGAGHASLREITRADILAVLPAQGTPRATLGAALRSIFSTLKRHHVLFLNPVARISIGNPQRRVPMPLDSARIRAAFNSTDPTTAAITALIGIHGLRPREACALHQVDVRDNHVFLPDRTILLAPATKARLQAYLAYRRDQWPGSINPHFLIHTRSATTLEQVRVPWLTDKLAMPAHPLRQDRILGEVHAGGDERRICDFFGVTIATAEYYASTMSHPDLDGFTTQPASSGTDAPH